MVVSAAGTPFDAGATAEEEAQPVGSSTNKAPRISSAGGYHRVARPAAASVRAGARRRAGTRALFALSARSPGLHELLLPADRYGVVMTQLHRVRALTPGESFEPELIFRNFGQGHKRLQGGPLAR
jgi:hypothetical protein